MPLFGKNSDIALFRHLNRELIHDIIDTTVDIMKSSVLDIDENLYGESSGKSYFQAVRVGALISFDKKEFESTEFGLDVTAKATFSLLRDDLVDIPNLVVESGDIIHWNDVYWEIDTVNDDDYFAGQNPETSNAGDKFGWNIGIICETHMTRRRKIESNKSDFGYNKDIY